MINFIARNLFLYLPVKIDQYFTSYSLTFLGHPASLFVVALITRLEYYYCYHRYYIITVQSSYYTHPVIGADSTGAAGNLPRYPQDNRGKDGFLPW